MNLMPHFREEVGFTQRCWNCFGNVGEVDGCPYITVTPTCGSSMIELPVRVHVRVVFPYEPYVYSTSTLAIFLSGEAVKRDVRRASTI